VNGLYMVNQRVGRSPCWGAAKHGNGQLAGGKSRLVGTPRRVVKYFAAAKGMADF